MNKAFSNLQAKILAQQALVGLLGVHARGLPLFQKLAQRGFQLLRFQLGSVPPPPDVREFDATFASLMESRAAPDDQLAAADIVLMDIPVPLTVSRTPDLESVTRVAQLLATRLRPGQLIIVQSTSYPGMIRERLLPILAQRSLQFGGNSFLAFSPHPQSCSGPINADDPGPRIVAGLDRICPQNGRRNQTSQR